MLVSILIAAASALALGQGAPSQIDAALLDLSARLGYSVDISNLSNWRWEQTNFPNDALGCPSASSSGGGAVLGYKFQLTHRAITHDYRVSNDSALVVYCGLVDAAAEARGGFGAGGAIFQSTLRRGGDGWTVYALADQCRNGSGSGRRQFEYARAAFDRCSGIVADPGSLAPP